MFPREPSVRMGPRGRTESLAAVTLAALSAQPGHLQRRAGTTVSISLKGLLYEVVHSK